MHTPRHIRKNSGFSTQDEHMVRLGLEALTEALYLRYATCSNYMAEEYRNAIPDAIIKRIPSGRELAEARLCAEIIIQRMIALSRRT